MKLQKVETPEGLPEKKAKEIKEVFQPMLEKMVELEEEANEIFAKKQTKKRSADAKKLRLKLVKVRTGTAKIHKQLKAFYVAGGKFVDGFRNTQAFAGKELEEKLKDIEVYYEEEEKRIAEEQERQAKEAAKKELAEKDAEIERLRKLLAKTAPVEDSKPVDEKPQPPTAIKGATNGQWIEPRPKKDLTIDEAVELVSDKLDAEVVKRTDEGDMVALVADLIAIRKRYEFDDPAYQEIFEGTKTLINKIVEWLNEKVSKLQNGA